ncbi:MAG: hypothetical protein ABS87_08275 [Sphingomonas sp. SCN 67-18]|nr:MAG: hypothetical protein ABS87_08275 [Sphingomonas sp. SCN 67-18]
MLSSEVGLFTVPHVIAPAGMDDLAGAVKAVSIPDVSEQPIRFIPGIRTPPGDRPDGWMQADLMRGEEVETFGALEALAESGSVAFDDDRPAPAVRTTPIRPSVPAQLEAQADRREARRDFRQERREDRADFRQERRDDRRDLRNGQFDNRRDFQRDRAEDRRDFRQDRRDDRRDFRRDRANDQRDWRDNRGNDRRWDRGNDNRNWSRDWRRDQRYDWQRYRQQNRRFYHLPRYYAPRGYSYGYRRFSIGISIGAAFYGSNYWINDPWMYRLPPAYGDYRWVRYYDDVLLIDMRTGYVVDVIYDFFY